MSNLKKSTTLPLLGKTARDRGGFGSTGTNWFWIFLEKMSFTQTEKQKDYFFKCYIVIENITSITHWFCCCKYYFGSQTIHNYLGTQKRYCCYCQFKDSYNLSMLHDVKKDLEKLKNFYYGILDEINQITFSRNLDCSVSNFDIICPFGYASEQGRTEWRDFLFCSRWLGKVYYWYC